MKSSFNVLNEKFFSVDDARIDVNFWLEHNIDFNPSIPFSTLFEVLDPINVDYNQLPDSFDYCQIGDLKDDESLRPTKLLKSEYGNEDNDDFKLYEKVFKKDRGGNNQTDDIMKVKPNDILIAKTRPLLNKIILIRRNQYDDNSKYFYTKAFLRLRVKNSNVSPELAFYVLKRILNKELVSVSKIGKSGYPSLDTECLNLIRIPLDISKLENPRLNEEMKNLFMKNLKIIYQAKRDASEVDSKIKNKIADLQ